jgi:hypothetical protein
MKNKPHNWLNSKILLEINRELPLKNHTQQTIKEINCTIKTDQAKKIRFIFNQKYLGKD